MGRKARMIVPVLLLLLGQLLGGCGQRETEEPETEEPETEEPETEEPETEEPETEEPETEEPETEEPEAEESESEELISEKVILENDAEGTLYGQEDYSEIISIYEILFRDKYIIFHYFNIILIFKMIKISFIWIETVIGFMYRMIVLYYGPIIIWILFLNQLIKPLRK